MSLRERSEQMLSRANGVSLRIGWMCGSRASRAFMSLHERREPILSCENGNEQMLYPVSAASNIVSYERSEQCST